MRIGVGQMEVEISRPESEVQIVATVGGFEGQQKLISRLARRTFVN